MMNLQTDKKVNSLYIHIPFCKNICNYCDFCKYFYSPILENQYCEELFKDINKLPNQKFKTIYIGGGTPSILSYENSLKLLKLLKNKRNKFTEFTIEANIDSIDENKLKLYKKYGVNRLSIGIQSFDQDNLKILGINHDFNLVSTKLKLVKKYFKNFNLDLIYGMTFSNKDKLINDLKLLVGFNPKHISTYSLIIEDNTNLKYKKYTEMDGDQCFEEYKLIDEFLKSNGYIRYEISNYAKKGYYSKHNYNYWNNDEYYGIGVGASGYINKIRYKITPSLKLYSQGIRVIEEEKIDKNNEIKYYIMLKLRTTKGINLIEFKNKFNLNFIKLNSVKDFIDKNVLIIKNNYIFLSNDYLFVEDFVVRKIFENF